jgi:hypothetical protein
VNPAAAQTSVVIKTVLVVEHAVLIRSSIAEYP